MYTTGKQQTFCFGTASWCEDVFFCYFIMFVHIFFASYQPLCAVLPFACFKYSVATIY